MDEARDMELVSIPFAAGVAASFCLPRQAGMMSLCMAAASILFIIRNPRRTAPVPLLFLFLGIFCGISGCSPAIATDGIAARAADGLRSLIDSIPYRHTRSNDLVKALMTGDRSGLDRDTVDAFRKSGASHILALSGLHLGLIHLIIKKTLAILGNSPAIWSLRSMLTVAFAGFYTMMTGASPSTVRAFLFICINEWTSVSPRRKSSPARSLLLALTIQLAASPPVISSLSFQMSYLAMCGIVFVLPELQSWYPGGGSRISPFKRIWDAAALSISCQIFTAPLAWIRFHTFPPYFLLTNILALPVTSAAMLASAAVTALHAAGICPPALIQLNDFLLETLVSILETISAM